MKRKRLGVVTDGAFNGGLTVRLDPGCSTEDLRIGEFVIVEGAHNRYFSMISDMQLRATDVRLLADPPRDTSPLIAQALSGINTYATVQVKRMLMLEKGNVLSLRRPELVEGSKGDQLTFLDELSPPQPVRTIPMHLAELCQADPLDFATVFGKEGGLNFALGTPLTMDIPICVKLDRLVERSTGIFGQTGTGKSFLVRILLCGIIQAGVGVNLIFDMHDEYAFGKRSEDGQWVKGLRHLFGSKVLIYSVDERAASRDGRNVDVTLKIGLNQIEAEDVMLLAEELDLTPASRTTVGLLHDSYGKEWLRELLRMRPDDIAVFCQAKAAHQGATEALQRKLRDVGRLDYVVDEVPFSVIDEMVAALDKGRHVILHFGRHDRPLDHMLVANIVTRWCATSIRGRSSATSRPRPLPISPAIW